MVTKHQCALNDASHWWKSGYFLGSGTHTLLVDNVTLDNVEYTAKFAYAFLQRSTLSSIDIPARERHDVAGPFLSKKVAHSLAQITEATSDDICPLAM
jgi:hypothetical protein